jgi:hypothetical protein
MSGDVCSLVLSESALQIVQTPKVYGGETVGSERREGGRRGERVGQDAGAGQGTDWVALASGPSGTSLRLQKIVIAPVIHDLQSGVCLPSGGVPLQTPSQATSCTLLSQMRP